MDRRKSPTVAFLIVAFLLAQIPFSLGEWMAVGQAPEEGGIYDVIIEATHDGIKDTFPLLLDVAGVAGGSESLSVEPVYPFGREPPITLRYNISINGSADINMVSNNLSVYYASGDTLLKSEQNPLIWEANESYWETAVNVPFKGEYEAVVSLVVQKDGKTYSGDFVSAFSSDNPSSLLELDYSIDKKVMIPAESFEVRLIPEFGDDILPGLEIFKASLYGNTKTLIWNRLDLRYDSGFTAPTDEGIYPISIYAEEQGSVNKEKIYVAEISRAKSGRCPLAYEDVGGCEDMEDVRKCVSDYKSDILELSENELIGCFDSAGGEAIVKGSVVCDGRYVGDLDGDKELGLGDLQSLQNIILPLKQSMRQEYVKCADYDLDGDVDEQDLQCMTNVVSKKWAGDLNGGVCFDIEYDTPLKCDLNGDNFIDSEDSILMRDLVEAADAGIEMPEEVLGTCDFDQDERITQEDWTCQEYFKGMDLDDPQTLLGGGRTIPSKCMEIYTLDQCAGIRGDINGDLKIDEVDEVLIMLIEREQISGYDMECADVNEDDIITEEDIVCVLSYTAGDMETYFNCINCDESVPTEYREIVEICNDGYDNNCDGLIDRTSTKASADDCNCGPHTDCFYNWDNDGGQVPGIEDGNVKVCRKLSWDTGDEASSGHGYRWVYPVNMQCSAERECETVECKDSVWKCAFDGTSWDWYGSPSDIEEENDDPLAQPKVCEDGYDNDCKCGDKECKEKEQGDMFSSWEFWVGAVVGVVLSFIPGLNLLVVGLIMAALSVGSTFAGCEGCAAFFSGVSIGVSVGGLAQNLAGTGATEAAKTGTQETAQGAVRESTGKLGSEAGKEALAQGTKEAGKEGVKKTGEEIATESLTQEIKAGVSEEAKNQVSQQISQEAGKEMSQEAVKAATDKALTEAAQNTAKNMVADAARNQALANAPFHKWMGMATKDFFAGFASPLAGSGAAGTVGSFGSSVGGMFWGGASALGSGYATQQAAMEFADSRAEWVTHSQSCS